MTETSNTPVSRRRFLATSAGVAIAATGAGGLLAACGSTSSSAAKRTGPRTLVVWHNYTQKARSDFMRQVADKFQQQNPGLTVQIEVVPFPAFATKWPAAQAAGTLPDVTTLLPEQAVSMWSARALNPMDDVLKSLGGANAFKTGLLDKLAKYQGRYILLPHYVHVRLLIHRNDLLQQAGVTMPDSPTWDDALKAAVATTKAPDRYGWILQLSQSDNGGGYLLWILSQSNGGHFFDKDGNVTFDSNEVREAVEYMTQLGRQASPPSAVNYNINDGFSLINSGKTVMTADSPAIIGTAAQQAPDVANNLATSFTPRKKQVGNLINGVSLAMPKGKNPEDAKAFVQFLYSQDNYVPFLQTIPMFMFPALKSADTPAFYANPTIAKFSDTAKRVLQGVDQGAEPGFDFGPNPYAGPVFASHLAEQMMQSILVNNTPVNQAVSQTAQQMKSLIDDIKSRTSR